MYPLFETTLRFLIQVKIRCTKNLRYVERSHAMGVIVCVFLFRSGEGERLGFFFVQGVSVVFGPQSQTTSSRSRIESKEVKVRRLSAYLRVNPIMADDPSAV